MRNSPPQPRRREELDPEPRGDSRGPVLARRQCETYAEECALLAAQCQSAKLRHLLLRAAESWRWLAGAGHP